VPNVPSVAARSTTLALTNSILPYLLEVADSGFDRALAGLPELRRGTYVHRGRCAKESLAISFALPWTPLAPESEAGA
jgi:alanine dehydrogenase